MPRAAKEIELTDRVLARFPEIAGLTRLLRQYASVGFTKIDVDKAGRNLLITGPRYRAKFDLGGVTVEEQLGRQLPMMRAADMHMRFAHAAADMYSAGCAADFLAAQDVAHGFGVDPQAALNRVLQVGLVTTYCRPFTGQARLAKKNWLPQGAGRLELHMGLMDARDHIYAHADHTAYRALHDPYGGTDLPILIEQAIPREVLSAIAVMCREQQDRFQAEAKRLLDEISPALVRTGTLIKHFDT